MKINTILNTKKVILIHLAIVFIVYITDATTSHISQEISDKIPNEVNNEARPICCIDFTVNNGTYINDFENLSQWIIEDGSQATDTINFTSGTQGLKLIAQNGDPASTNLDINIPVYLTTYSFDYYVDNASNLETISFAMFIDNWENYYSVETYDDPINGWNHVTINSSDIITTDYTNVTHSIIRIKISIYPKMPNSVNVTFDNLKYGFKARPKIIFAFDDGYNTIYDNVFPVMKANNQTGVVFVITGYIGIVDSYLTLPSIVTMFNSGWDISSHTENHMNLLSLDSDNVSLELNNSFDHLANNGFGKSSWIFAYPYGNSYNQNILNSVKKRYVLARSSYDNRYQIYHPSSSSGDLNYQLRTQLVINTTLVSEIKSRINASINDGGIMVLTFHNIVNSSADTDSKYLTSDFQIVSDYIASRNTDIDVITFSDLLIYPSRTV